MGRAVGWIIGLVIVVAVAWIAFMMVDVDVTQEGQLPEVSVSGGQMPEADVNVGTVDVGSEQRTVEVPSIEVNPPADN
ncbi:hypothetical protein [Aureimonas populi]|uniref:Uncharacterized protein n=1 Tax=Aureimonas populi TaxID=1701758 RepID=A0ABW5CIV2_9HYPH|nr:hypothetical protein [Aureimonas populi]